MKKILTIIFVLVVLVFIAFLAGPRSSYEPVDARMPSFKMNIAQLDQFIAQQEAKIPNIKEDNQGRIYWNDSVPKRTAYSLVYLHGFSASQEEGDPVHRQIAHRYGMNLYIPRLEGHGLDTKESFGDLNPKNYMDSAKEALAIGQILGEKVVVMSCSTGSTLAIYLAAEHPELVSSLILYSPNIDLFDPKSSMLTGPWGQEILTKLNGGDYRFNAYDSLSAQYWNNEYKVTGLIAVKDLINQTMTKETFTKIKQPVFLGCYYKDDEHQDHAVSVKAMDNFFQSISTPAEQKKMIKFPDVSGHVFVSYVKSKDYLVAIDSTTAWIDKVLQLPIKDTTIVLPD